MKYSVNTEHYSKYVSKKYDTPTNIGIKWQMDVKVVSKQYYVGEMPDKFYQYIVIDEASCEHFIYPYKDQFWLYFVSRVGYVGHTDAILDIIGNRPVITIPKDLIK